MKCALNANFLISGAFGIFRKKEFTAVNGYDPDTVGEDMELVLRLQEMMKHSRSALPNALSRKQ